MRVVRSGMSRLSDRALVILAVVVGLALLAVQAWTAWGGLARPLGWASDDAGAGGAGRPLPGRVTTSHADPEQTIRSRALAVVPSADNLAPSPARLSGQANSSATCPRRASLNRTVLFGLTALILTACKPADQTPATNPSAGQAATARQLASAGPKSAPQPSAPMSWEELQDHYRLMKGEPTNPLEALESRAVICAHLSGEVGSDSPDQQQLVDAQIDKYQCEDALLADIQDMREARSDDAAAVRRLDTLLANLY